MAYWSSSSSSRRTIQYEGAPTKPDNLRLVLKEKSAIQRVSECTKSLISGQLMESLEADQKKILERIKSTGRNPTEEECMIINGNTKREVRSVFNQAEEILLPVLAIKPSDTAEVVQCKVEASSELTQWLSALFSWVVDQIQKIFSKLKEAFKRCIQEVKDFFKFLWGLIQD